MRSAPAIGSNTIAERMPSISNYITKKTNATTTSRKTPNTKTSKYFWATPVRSLATALEKRFPVAATPFTTPSTT
jgi:hypothetical protein